MPDALGPEHYQALYQASISPDPEVRAKAQALAQKLTPQEGQAFVDYQKSVHAPPSKTTSVLGVPITMVGETPRPDSNIIGTESGSGIAPEDVMLGGLAARGVARAASTGTGTVGSTVAGLKNALSQASPIVKYEVYHSALEYAGVPTPVARGLAMIAAGYQPGAKAAAPTPDPTIAADLASGRPMGAADALSRLKTLPADQRAAAMATRPAAVAAQPPAESPLDLTRRVTMENTAAAAPPAPPVTEPPVAPDNNVASPAAKAAVPVIRNMTTEQFQAVSKLPVEERQLYIRLRQVGDSHAEAIHTLDYARETQALREQAQTARAMVGKEKAASDLFGSSSPEAQQKLLELAPGPSRRPLAGEVAGLDARFKAMLADPKAAYILPFLGGTLGAAARRERGAE